MEVLSMPNNIIQLLREYRDELEKVTDNHIKKVILFGSYARGDFHDNSDIDVMVLVDLEECTPQTKLYEDKIYDVTYDFNWKYDTEIMPIVKNIQQFDYWKNAYLFYQNVDTEGVLI
jgi:predicted nucleotidyltransferase